MNCPGCKVRMRPNGLHGVAAVVSWSCPECGYEVEVRRSSLEFHSCFADESTNSAKLQERRASVKMESMQSAAR